MILVGQKSFYTICNIVCVTMMLAACVPQQQQTQLPDATSEVTRLYLVGDSTMASKIPERAPETGWGMALADLAKPSLLVENHAVNGRSSKSFYDEGRWQVVLDQLRAGDFVLIQFGHNDQKKADPKRYAAADGAYADNLRRYISEARAKGATPLLATSIVRRHFDDNGQLLHSHAGYPDAVRRVAKQMGVTLVDLQALTWRALEKLGPGPSVSLYLHVKPGEFSYYKDGKIDNTHLSPKGALWVARLFVEQLHEQNHALAKHFDRQVTEMPAQPESLKLWPNTPPVSAKLPGTEQLEDGRVANVREPEIIPFLAPAASARGVGVLIFPGGGYNHLAVAKEGAAVAQWLNAQGIHGFVVKYRMREFGAPAPLLDAQQAMRLVRSQSERWRLNPKKIGVIGFSAGGHVAASLLAHFDYQPPNIDASALDHISARPDFAMLIYPVVTMREPHAHAGSREALLGADPGAEQLGFYSVEEQVRPDMPPVFLVHGSNDQSVPVQNSLALYRAIHEQGVPAEMLIYSNAPHGMGLLAGYEQASEWPSRALEWLKSQRIILD